MSVACRFSLKQERFQIRCLGQELIISYFTPTTSTRRIPHTLRIASVLFSVVIFRSGTLPACTIHRQSSVYAQKIRYQVKDSK